MPWEANLEASHERKLNRYHRLAVQCREKGWQCELFAIEVGARGFVSSSVLSLFKRIGIRKRRCRKALRELSFAAESSSRWIWERYAQMDSFPRTGSNAFRPAKKQLKKSPS